MTHARAFAVMRTSNLASGPRVIRVASARFSPRIFGSAESPTRYRRQALPQKDIEGPAVSWRISPCRRAVPNRSDRR